MNEQSLTDYLEDYLRDDANFRRLDEEEQFKIFKVYQTVLKAVFQVVVYPKVTSLLFAIDLPSAELLQKALSKLSKIIPQVERIEIIIVN